MIRNRGPSRASRTVMNMRGDLHFDPFDGGGVGGEVAGEGFFEKEREAVAHRAADSGTSTLTLSFTPGKPRPSKS